MAEAISATTLHGLPDRRQPERLARVDRHRDAVGVGEDHLGPVEAIAIALPDIPAAAAWQALLHAVDAHQLRVLDVEFVRRTDADVERVPASEWSTVKPAARTAGSSASRRAR